MLDTEISSFNKGQQAAIDAKGNTVVSAGAGSGKTTVLAERFARLIEQDGLSIDSILTLTFTRKAAAEMYARIYKRLAVSSNPKAKEQLESFDKASIFTMDAFCAQIVRGSCHSYGIASDFSVDEARLARIADESAIALLMEHKHTPALRRMVATLGFDRVRGEFLGKIAMNEIGICREPSFFNDTQRQMNALAEEILLVSSLLEDNCRQIVAINEHGGDTVENAKKIIDGLLPFPEYSENDLVLAKFSEIAKTLSGSTIRKPGSNSVNPALVILREIIEPMRENAQRLLSISESYRMKEDYLAIASLMDTFSLQFLERKRRESILSFHDIVELATEILKSKPEVRGHYKRRIKAVMIDEFQDNDELQKNLLYLLAEREEYTSIGIPAPEDLAPDKLFFVGDEKQSIYRFRGADVSVFRKLSTELAQSVSTPTALDLSVNYRSTPQLISFYNALFPLVFGPAEHDYEARYSLIAWADDPISYSEQEPITPSVELHLYEAAEGDTENGTDDDQDGSPADFLSPAAAEAFAAATRIKKGYLSGEFTFGDVAVLFRSSTKQNEYERTFRMLDIPYTATDPRGLFDEAPISDLYNVLRLALFPGDRNAYAAMLRSPFIRIGDDSLARILLDDERKPFPSNPTTEWFTNSDDMRRFLRGRSLYEYVVQKKDLQGIAELTSHLWYDEGYRVSLLQNPKMIMCSNHFERFFELALDADRRHLTLAAFLDEITPLMGSSAKAEADDTYLPGSNVVRFMTIHKSKGLEFPVVLIPDAGNKGRGIRNSELYYKDLEFGIVPNLRRDDRSRKDKLENPYFERARLEESARELAELKRLLYVAATRAEKKLLLFGKPVKNINVPKSFLDLIQLSNLDPSFFKSVTIAPLGERERNQKVRMLTATSSGTEASNIADMPSPGKTTNPIVADFYTSAPAEARKEYKRTTTPSAIENAASSVTQHIKPSGTRLLSSYPSEDLIIGKNLENEFGSICHSILERMIGGGNLEIPPTLLFSLNPAQRAQILSVATVFGAAFLNTDLGRLASSANRRRTEFPFILAVPSSNGKPWLIKGKMDLIFEITRSMIKDLVKEGENPTYLEERCIIVDFKTDREFNPSAHVAQLACYRSAARAFSDFPIETWLFYLRDGITVRVMDEPDLSQLIPLAIATAENI